MTGTALANPESTEINLHHGCELMTYKDSEGLCR